MTPNAVVGPSAIHGNGLFAARNISMGEPIVTPFAMDVIFTQDETQAIAESAGVKTAEDLEEAVLAAVAGLPICPGFNHSCVPNCVRQNAEAMALRDIHEGDELTLWYGNWSAWRMAGLECFCPNCRMWAV